ncbi:ABC transporter permease [Romboutsia weinsteinii]|uniref:ABC transporter permease n=1 Tax=Romboutsia weinsteinii TaxID=2020949 RepID=A0A371J1W6_9FIRM|nr:ABC transporter permease [Romboutsia weinsteinii]RDY26770.1 ABC transporter permease [Romboutsia weinsteinii]
MNLFNISLKNVKKSFSNYVMYFISIVFSVFIFFSFKSIQYNDALSTLGSKTTAGINSASIVIALFSFAFIYYSNSFFLNRRKQEIGTYSMLGMRKNKIGLIFFYETLIMGAGAILLGVILGFLFSKIMTMMLVKMMGEAIIVNMNLSVKALNKTIIIFMIIFIIVAVRNTIIIKKTKLIELFKKEGEKTGQNKFYKIKGLLGILLIIIAYTIAKSKFILGYLTLSPLILVPIIPGTFLFFSSAIELILSMVKKNKKIYYKGRNLIAFSELSYKIQSNSKILATIAILIATSATILGFTASLYYDINRNVNENYKYSYTIREDNKIISSKIDEILKKFKAYNNIQLDKSIELVESEISYKLKSKIDGKIKPYNTNIELIKESDYRELKEYENKPYENLNSKDNTYYISDEFGAIAYENLKGSAIVMSGYKNNFMVKNEVNHSLLNTQSSMELLVVKDTVFNEIKNSSNTRILRIIDISGDNLEMAQEMEKLINDSMEFNYPFNFTSKKIMYNTYIQSGGLYLFIGVFLALVFLLCTGSIILFKQLSSIYDDKDRYIMLKKLGASNKDIEKIISKQLKIVFLLPLIIGTLHNLFAMSIVQLLIPRSIVVPLAITLAAYYAGYFIYYFITLKYAQNMIIDR